MRFFLASLLLTSSLLAQDTAPKDDQEWLQKEVGLEQMFRNPPERFSSLLFKRIDTVKVNGVERVRYSISSAGLEPGKRYIFMAWELGAEAPQVMLPAVQVDAKGVLHCDPEAKDCPGDPGSEVNVAVSDKPGQPSRFVIAGEDEQPLAIGEVIPNPSNTTDHECSAETVLLRPDATIALVIGHGFEPGEDIKVISTSYDEHVPTGGKASNKGDYQAVLMPFATGHDSGETMVTMNSSKCELSSQFSWGTTKPEAAEPAVARQPQPERPADEPPSSSLVAPVRTATEQIERAISEHAAAAAGKQDQEAAPSQEESAPTPEIPAQAVTGETPTNSESFPNAENKSQQNAPGSKAESTPKTPDQTPAEEASPEPSVGAPGADATPKAETAPPPHTMPAEPPSEHDASPDASPNAPAQPDSASPLVKDEPSNAKPSAPERPEPEAGTRDEKAPEQPDRSAEPDSSPNEGKTPPQREQSQPTPAPPPEAEQPAPASPDPAPQRYPAPKRKAIRPPASLSEPLEIPPS